MKFCISPYSDDAIYWGVSEKEYEHNVDTGCANFKFTLPSGEVIKLRVKYNNGSWKTNYTIPDGTILDVEKVG